MCRYLDNTGYLHIVFFKTTQILNFSSEDNFGAKSTLCNNTSKTKIAELTYFMLVFAQFVNIYTGY